MKKLSLCILIGLIIFLLPPNVSAQTEIIPYITIGSGGDITNQPIHGQSEFSHSQTIYYPDQLQFTGTINEIRFNTTFYAPSIMNSEQWIVKIGTTTVSAFLPADSFLNTSSFTQVFNGTISQNGYDIIITFSQPFYYNGMDNLVLDIEEVSPGVTSSAFLAFEGEENFGNPPLRSKMTFTSNGITQGVIENSFAQTHFYGSLETCIKVQSPDINGITQTSATVDLVPDPSITTYRYNLNLAGQNIPPTYNTTTNQQILLNNLSPASDYFFNVRSDCNFFNTDYLSVPFTTKPVALTIPSTIDFDGVNLGNYYLSTGVAGQIEISNLAGNGGTNGILFRGAQNTANGGSWLNYDIWGNNPEYISHSSFLIDLSAGATQPVFTFDLRQNAESYFRLKIDGYVQNVEYTSDTPNQDSFETITIDLSNYIGQIVSLEMQHISKFSGNLTNRSAFVDNVQLKESTCLKPTGISAMSTINSIDLSWVPNSGSQWQIRYVNHDANPDGGLVTSTTNPATLNGLATAKPYDIYIRKDCGNTFSAWAKTIQSTVPFLIDIPYKEDFQGILSDYCSPVYHNSSEISFNSDYVVLHQNDKGDDWMGGLITTEYEAWNDNKEFTTGLNFRVDATNLTQLMMDIRFKLTYFFSSQTSWFRIKVNGNQIGNSYNPTNPSSNPYQIQQLDLSAYLGGIVEVSIEHCGRSDEYSVGGAMDAVTIDYVHFTGELQGVSSINVVPAPTTADISWTPAANEAEWEIEYGPQGFSPGSGIIFIDNDGTPSETITGLTAATSYDIYITAICGSGCSSPQVGPESFVTLNICPPVANINVNNIQSSSAEISWTPGGGETQWQIEYGPSGFSTGSGTTLLDNDGILGETLSGLFSATTYDVYVTAICPASQSNPVGPVSFTTLAFCDAVSSIILDSLTDVSVGLDWNPTNSETEWKIEYDLSGFTLGSGTVFSDTDGIQNEVISGLTPQTTYDLYVIAVCGPGNESLASGPLTVTTFATCIPVANITVSNISDISADISWTPGGNETEWEIEYGLQGFAPGLGTTVTDNNALGETISGLSPNTSYDVYVTAICSSNQSNVVGPVNFVTLVSCPDVTNIICVNITNTSIDLGWTGDGNETEWEIEYGFTGFTPGSGTLIATTANPTNFTGLTPQTSYDFYVTAICSNNVSGQVGPATCSTLSIADQVFEGFAYYPNPVSYQLSLKAINQIQQVVIYDLLGQVLIKTKPNSLKSVLEFDNFQAGTYLMEVTINGSVGMFRIIKE